MKNRTDKMTQATSVTQVVMIGYIHYPTDNRVRREAEALAATGRYRIRVLTPRNGEDDPQQYAGAGITIVEMTSGKYRGRSKLRYLLAYVWFMVRAFLYCSLKVRSIDVVHIHNMPDFLVFAALVPRLTGKKVILDVHDTMPETYGAKFPGRVSGLLTGALKLEERLSCLMATNIISVTHPQKELLAARGVPEGKVTVTMNVPDPGVFKPSTNGGPAGKTGDGLRLVYHGTVTRRLGIDLVIRAVARLRGRGEEMKFFIFGNGEDLEDFAQLSRELGVDDAVIFNRKFIPMEELIPVLRTMDIGVIGNRRSVAADYMLPVKMMEYAILGIPVVVPRLKTIEFYFSSSMVGYFQPEDLDSLTEAVSRLGRDRDLRAAQARRANVFIGRYGWEEHKQDLIDLYDG